MFAVRGAADKTRVKSVESVARISKARGSKRMSIYPRFRRLISRASRNRRLLVSVALLLLLLLVLEEVCLAYVMVYRETPSVHTLFDYEPPLVSKIYDRNGGHLHTYWSERRREVSIESLPDHVKKAFLAAEDADFYSHEGLDYPGILRAAMVNVLRGEVRQGGSTITQQVIRNYYLTPEKSFSRKIKEAVMARELEQKMGKDRIFEIYMNMVYFGAGAWGLEEASLTYFGVSADELDLSQAALLAGLIQAPSRFCPFYRPELARNRMEWVLGQMVKHGFISTYAAETALRDYKGVQRRERNGGIPAPYYIKSVKRRLREILGDEAYQKGGYKIYTSMDPRTQDEAEEAVKTWLEDLDRRMRGRRVRTEKPGPSEKESFFTSIDQKLGKGPLEKGAEFQALISGKEGRTLKLQAGSRTAEVPIWRTPWRRSRNVPVGSIVTCRVRRDRGEVIEVDLVQDPRLEGALVAIDPHTREVLALVGGYDYEQSRFNRATQSRRPPGSAMKPIVFSAAFSTRKYNPTTIINDRPFTVRHKGSRWRPKNYSKRYYGETTLHEALVHSRNVVTVRLAHKIGVEAIIERASEMGIKEELPDSLSISLGAYGVSLLDITNSYAVFASGGLAKDPLFIKRVEDRDGNIIYRADSPPRRVLPEGEAFMMNYVLSKVVEDGTAKKARYIGCRSAGKTGTTNDYRDAWYVGYTPRMVVGTWVGKDDYSTMPYGYTGGKAALPMYVRFAKKAFSDMPSDWFEKPKSVYYTRGTCLLKGTRPDRRKRRYRPDKEEEKKLQKEAEEISELLSQEAEEADKKIGSKSFGEEHLKAFLYADLEDENDGFTAKNEDRNNPARTGTATKKAEQKKPAPRKKAKKKTSGPSSPLPPGVVEDLSRVLNKSR